MSSPPPRGHVVPIRSVNENRALRQAAVFSGSAVGAHSPTKSPLEPKGLMVLPKAAAAGNPSKSKILPPLHPAPADDTRGESGQQLCAADERAAPNLRDMGHTELTAGRASIGQLTPVPCDEGSANDAGSDDPAAVPAPILLLGRRPLRRPAAPPLQPVPPS
jgi:hypothetical protein